MPAKAPDRSLKAFFDNWVYGTGIPTVKLVLFVARLKLTGDVLQRDVDDDFSAFVPVEVQIGKQKKRLLAAHREAIRFHSRSR